MKMKHVMVHAKHKCATAPFGARLAAIAFCCFFAGSTYVFRLLPCDNVMQKPHAVTKGHLRTTPGSGLVSTFSRSTATSSSSLSSSDSKKSLSGMSSEAAQQIFNATVQMTKSHLVVHILRYNAVRKNSFDPLYSLVKARTFFRFVIFVSCWLLKELLLPKIVVPFLVNCSDTKEATTHKYQQGSIVCTVIVEQRCIEHDDTDSPSLFD